MTTRQAFWFNVRFFVGMWRPEFGRGYLKTGPSLTFTSEESK